MLAELRRRKRSIRVAVGQLEVASANLVRPLLIDPHALVAPVEPTEAIIRLIPDDVPLDDLIRRGWQNRPELARSRELVEAAVLRLKQAKLRPFVPSLAVTYSGGGFGGGPNAFFGNFNTRGDVAASLFWELRGLGLNDRGSRRVAEAQKADRGHRLRPRPGLGLQRRGRGPHVRVTVRRAGKGPPAKAATSAVPLVSTTDLSGGDSPFVQAGVDDPDSFPGAADGVDLDSASGASRPQGVCAAALH